MKALFSRIAVVCTAVLTLFGCGNKDEQRELVHLTGSTMGTYYSIKFIKQPDLPSLTEIQTEIDRRLEKVNDQMSTYRKDSELSQWNQNPSMTPIKVSTELAKVVKEAQRIAELSNGAYDITIGPLVNLWSFGPEARPDQAPTNKELSERRQWVGYKKLTLDKQTLSKASPELYIDLSSIAKGYGVDVIADYLHELNVHNYLVEIGGELRLNGVNLHHQPWRIAVEKPVADGSRAIQEIIEPGNMGVATSGDYRNYFEQDGVHYSHLINPKTGKPISNHVVSVTVIAPTCMTADGFATAFSVMDKEESLALANRENIPMLLMVKTAEGFEAIPSNAFLPYMKHNRE